MKSVHVCVVGDFMLDVNRFYATVRPTGKDADYPVVELVREERTPGGAGAVAAMAEAQGARVTRIGGGMREPLKRRHIVDGKIAFRDDRERCVPIATEYADRLVSDVPADCDVILCSDYAKGIVTERLWAGLVRVGPPILVDAHPGKYYPGAWGLLRSGEFADWWPREIRKYGAHGFIACDHAGEHGTHLREYYPRCKAAVDPCGAGDMLLASMGVAIANGCSWFDAAEWAAAACAEECRRWGAVCVPLEAIDALAPWLREETRACG